jgi:DNA-binding NarL/FixJ family response regulator
MTLATARNKGIAAIRKAMKKTVPLLTLTPREELLVREFYLKGSSMKEVAKRLHLTLEEVLGMRNRALRKLRHADRADVESFFSGEASLQSEFTVERRNQFEELMLKLAQDIEDITE